MPEYDGRAATFDTVAEAYDAARPGYPAELFADLREIVGTVASPPRVLEVGIGTGQATRGLLGLGWPVVGLEPGRELARVARRMLAGRGDLVVEPVRFEDYRPPEELRFDVVLAATAWHWVDGDVGYRRAAELLRPAGLLAVVATRHVLPEDGDPFFRDVEQAYVAAGLGGRGGVPEPPQQVPDPDVAAMGRSGLFEPGGGPSLSLEPGLHRREVPPAALDVLRPHRGRARAAAAAVHRHTRAGGESTRCRPGQALPHHPPDGSSARRSAVSRGLWTVDRVCRRPVLRWSHGSPDSDPDSDPDGDPDHLE